MEVGDELSQTVSTGRDFLILRTVKYFHWLYMFKHFVLSLFHSCYLQF